MSDRSRVATTLHQNDLLLRQDGLRGLWRSSLAHSPPLKLQTSVFGTVVRVRVGAKRAASLYSGNGTHNTNTSNVFSVPKSFWYQSLSSRYRRLEFSGAGETDGGLGFGFNFRAGNASDADDGTAGSVFISQGGHTLAMGDVDSAANAAVGQVSGVGFTGLHDHNEVGYDLNDEAPSVLYSYTGGALAFHVGLGGDMVSGDEFSLGVAYDAGTFNVALGVEDDDGNSGVYLGVGVDLGAVALNAVLADSDGDGDEWAVSADFTSGATTFTAYVADDNGDGSWGLGASHDLGGGAPLNRIPTWSFDGFPSNPLRVGVTGNHAPNGPEMTFAFLRPDIFDAGYYMALVCLLYHWEVVPPHPGPELAVGAELRRHLLKIKHSTMRK